MTAPALASSQPAASTAADVRAGVLTTLAVAALGVPVALIWHAVAPRVLYRVSAGAGMPVDFGTQGFIADDGWFFVITGVAGVLTGVVAWAIGRRHSVAIAIGIGLGGIAAAIVAWKLGTAIGSGGLDDALRAKGSTTTVRGPLTLGAKGCLVAWPIAALIGLVVGMAYESAGGRPAEQPQLPVSQYGEPVRGRLPDDAG